MYLCFARHPPLKRLDVMFDKLRARRHDARSWLLVRPGSLASDPWQWCRVPANQSGDWPPPASFLQDTIALVVPAAWGSHFLVPAPPGLKRHEWPMLLEDLLQQPAAQVQVHCLSRVGGQLELLVTERERISGWLADCEALGIAPTCLWTEMQLLPDQPPGQMLRWTRRDDSCCKRGGEGGAQHWLTWPHLLGELPESWREPTEEMTGTWPDQWAPLGRVQNLLAADASRRVKTQRRPALLSRTHRGLTGLCALLAISWAAVAAVQFWQQVPVWKTQVEAVTGPVGNVQQAARSLARLQAQQTDWRSRQQQVAELESAVSAWLAGQQGWGVSGNYFDGRSWRLVLNGNLPAPPLAHWQAMGKAVGATASVEPDTKPSLLTVNFDLGVQP